MTSRSPLRILLVDDAPDAEAFVARWLQADVPYVQVNRVPGAVERAVTAVTMRSGSAAAVRGRTSVVSSVPRPATTAHSGSERRRRRSGPAKPGLQ